MEKSLVGSVGWKLKEGGEEFGGISGLEVKGGW